MRNAAPWTLRRRKTVHAHEPTCQMPKPDRGLTGRRLGRGRQKESAPVVTLAERIPISCRDLLARVEQVRRALVEGPEAGAAGIADYSAWFAALDEGSSRMRLADHRDG